MNQSEKRHFYSKLGLKLREARKNAGYSQEQLGGAVELSRVSISNIEQGRQYPPLHQLWTICRFLDLNLGAILNQVQVEQDKDISEKVLTKIESQKKNAASKETVKAFIKSIEFSSKKDQSIED